MFSDRSRLQGQMCLALAMLTVGSTVVAGKFAAPLPLFTGIALRFAIATPLLALAMRMGGVRRPRLGRRTVLLLVLQAAAGSVGYTACLLAGLRLTSAGDAGVLLGALPAMTGLLAVCVLRERVSLRGLAAIALATAGVALTAAQGGASAAAAPHALAGDALVLAAVACEAAFLLLDKRLPVPVPPLAQATLMSGFGLLLALPVALVERSGQPLGHWPPAAWAGVVWYALVPTVLGYWLWYRGAACLSGTQAAPFTALAPPAALALSALVLGEPLHAAQLAGTALVICGVLVGASARSAAAAQAASAQA
ncbi:DMT family transporter [Rhodanobacter aciditrophus]|uniref:DMT family transporter n=1 Tax=Rhodanobacter aciditrophus TaxID=1623218 RepID=UPI003CFA51C4